MSGKVGGVFVERQSFLSECPKGTVDVVLNRRALSQLPAEGQRQAACNFERCIRPGGHAIIDTLNVQGEGRSVLEDSLLGAGFYIPCHKAERWYRDRLNETGIVYAMILGRPIIPQWNQYPPDEFEKRKQEDKAILESFRAEYEERLSKEVPEARSRMNDGKTKVAHVIYSTG